MTRRQEHATVGSDEATKLAGAAGTKGSADPTVADQLLAKIEEISKIFWETKQG
jgi:nickel superoxide dismutase